MGFFKDISGEKFGYYEIIGDTGKRDKNRNVIAIARNNENGELHEGLAGNFKYGRLTGFIGSEEHKKQASDRGIKNVHKLHAITNVYGTNTNFINDTSFSDNITGYRNVFFSENAMRWNAVIVFKKETYRKSFSNFADAVLYVNDFKIKYLNPLIEGEEKKIGKIYPCEIKRNEYVTEKQEEIYRSIKETKVRSAEAKRNYHYKKAKGVSWKKDKKKWKAYITLNKKQKHLGYFTTEQEAIQARRKAVDEYL